MDDGDGSARPVGPSYDQLFWATADVMRELHVSRPTAYKLMHDSDALVGGQRYLRVYVPRFIQYMKNSSER